MAKTIPTYWIVLLQPASVVFLITQVVPYHWHNRPDCNRVSDSSTVLRKRDCVKGFERVLDFPSLRVGFSGSRSSRFSTAHCFQTNGRCWIFQLARPFTRSESGTAKGSTSLGLAIAGKHIELYSTSVKIALFFCDASWHASSSHLAKSAVSGHAQYNGR